MASSPVRSILTVVMDLLIVVAVLLVLRVLVEFFGALQAQSWAEGYMKLTGPLVLPLGLDPVENDYGGAFAVDASVSILVYLAAEWVVSVARKSR